MIPQVHTSGTERRFITVKVNKELLVRVLVPNNSSIEKGVIVRLHKLRTKLLNLERYVFLGEEKVTQQIGPADAGTSGPRR